MTTNATLNNLYTKHIDSLFEEVDGLLVASGLVELREQIGHIRQAFGSTLADKYEDWHQGDTK